MTAPSVTVIGNLSIDRIDGGARTPGGAPAFAAAALRAGHAEGRILTRLAPADRRLFSSMLHSGDVPLTVLDAGRTSAFELRYEGERRTLSVAALGERWRPEEIQEAPIDSAWVHVAPLLRDEFPAETLAALAAAGRRLSYDGQGLVRPRRLGPLRLDTAYDPSVLRWISVLKLSQGEARVLADGEFDAAAAARLGVPEIVVTLGSAGCDLYSGGEVIRVTATPVPGVHATGAGDTFMVVYAARRAVGAPPVQAAAEAQAAVAQLLTRRRSAER